MTRPRVVAVGAPHFRRDVAIALDAPAETVPWVQNTTDVHVILEGPEGPPDVVILSPDLDVEQVLDLSLHMSLNSPATAVVLVRHQNPNGMMPALVRAGVRDFVQAENGPAEMKEALGRALLWSQNLQSRRPTAPESTEHGMLITVFSSKGGTGKSFLASNLSTSIARMGNATAVVDIDVAMGDVLSYFGAEADRPLQDIVNLGDRLDQEGLKSLGTKLADNLWGFGSPPDVGALDVSGQAMTRTLQSFKSAFPYTIVDVPASYNEGVLAALDMSDFVCVIAGLDVVGIKHLGKAIETLIQIGVPRDRLMVVVNRADSKVGLQPSDVERVLNIKVDALIPSSRAVPASLNKGRPVVLEEPKANVSVSIDELAGKLAAIGHTTSDKSAVTRKKRFTLGRS